MDTSHCGCKGKRTEERFKDTTRIVDQKASLLIAAGAAMAANCEPCLNKIIPELREAGAGEAEIRMAVEVGQVVKDKPATRMKEAADMLAGSHLSEKVMPQECPLDKTEPGEGAKMIMLVAAGAAMAANCEPCLNQVVPLMIEAGVADADIRRAVVIGQTVKDKPALLMKEAADALTGTRLSGKSTFKECTSEELKQETACCG